jgi:hypothetical protein
VSVRKPWAVHAITGGALLVRGTQDPVQALRLVLDDRRDEDCSELEGIVTELYRPHVEMALLGSPVQPPLMPGFCRTAAPSPSMVGVFADRLFDLLAAARHGLYRIIPGDAGTGEEWSWHYIPQRRPGPGVFPGVEFGEGYW